MNFLRKLRDYVKNPSHSRTMGLLAVLLLVFAISLTVVIAQRQQTLKQYAAEPSRDDIIGSCTDDSGTKYDYCNSSGSYIVYYEGAFNCDTSRIECSNDEFCVGRETDSSGDTQRPECKPVLTTACEVSGNTCTDASGEGPFAGVCEDSDKIKTYSCQHNYCIATTTTCPLSHPECSLNSYDIPVCQETTTVCVNSNGTYNSTYSCCANDTYTGAALKACPDSEGSTTGTCILATETCGTTADSTPTPTPTETQTGCVESGKTCTDSNGTHTDSCTSDAGGYEYNCYNNLCSVGNFTCNYPNYTCSETGNVVDCFPATDVTPTIRPTGTQECVESGKTCTDENGTYADACTSDAGGYEYNCYNNHCGVGNFTCNYPDYTCSETSNVVDCVPAGSASTPTPTPILTSAPAPTARPDDTVITFDTSAFNYLFTNDKGERITTKSKDLTIYLYDSTDTPATSDPKGEEPIAKNNNPARLSPSGIISVNLGKVPAGTYKVLLKNSKYLRITLASNLNITSSGGEKTLATTNFSKRLADGIGDVDDNNVLNVADYNAIVGCLGSKQNTSSCVADDSADLNDDGEIDGVDLNYFLVSLSFTSREGD